LGCIQLIQLDSRCSKSKKGTGWTKLLEDEHLAGWTNCLRYYATMTSSPVLPRKSADTTRGDAEAAAGGSGLART
ncbi:unnamed protein product, partial [Tenebrio molitor]